MIFTYREYLENTQNYVSNAPKHSKVNYQIVVSAKDNNITIKNDVSAIRQFLSRQKKLNNNIIFYIGVSKHSSNGNVRKYKSKTKKKGRPRIIITGVKSVEHAHIFIASDNTRKSPKEVYQKTLKFIKKRSIKHNNLKQSKSSIVNGMGFVKYVERQAEHYYTDGKYNWNYFNNIWYDDTNLN